MKEISFFRTDILPLKNELFRLALRITLNRDDAEDVVQETMLKVWNRRNQWSELESIEAFCLTVCRNVALDKMKAPIARTHRSKKVGDWSTSTVPTPPTQKSRPYSATVWNW